MKHTHNDIQQYLVTIEPQKNSHILTAKRRVWETPTVKRALPNQRSPRQLQRPFVLTLHSDKSIKMRTSDTLASMEASCERCNIKISEDKTRGSTSLAVVDRLCLRLH
jgi:hypothetical protein